jgi:sulfoxide reductase heme-binding subunit YedZ
VTQATFIRRVVKPAAFIACLVPLGLIVWDGMTGGLSANPVEDITHRTGTTALVLLLVTLGVTPVRRLTKVGALVNLRRPLGLFAFFYASVHFLIYLGLDQLFSLAYLGEDIAKRPYITVGFTALVLLVPLAVTSTKGWIKRLGGKRWNNLHRLVYVSAALGVLHYLWLVKADTRTPIIYGVVLVGLLATRLRTARAKRQTKQPARQSGPTSDTETPATISG